MAAKKKLSRAAATSPCASWGCKVAALLLLLPASGYGATISMDAVSADVQQVCTQPATQGQHWTVTGTATGTVGVQINSLASSSGTLSFTGDQWSGVQRVLAADQAGDNENYRRCVEALTPLFLAKIPAALRDPAEVERKLRAFLAAKQLAVPGQAYGDAELASQYGVRPMPTGLNVSNPVLNGNYRGLSVQDSNSPIGSFSRLFAEQNGTLVGVMIVETCAGNAALICANNYADWKSSIEPIVGSLQESKLNLAFGAGGGPFANSGGTLTKSIAYDNPWRVYLDRVDPSSGGGPTAITLLVANSGQ
jgi:hypothetical protein